MYRTRPTLWALAVVAFTLALPTPAFAYGWMIRHGYFGCSTCHVSPQGGNTLTAYGRVQGDLLLRMHYGRSELESKDASTADVEAEKAQDEADFGGEENTVGDDSLSTPAPDNEAPGTDADDPWSDDSWDDDSDFGEAAYVPEVSRSAGFLWGLIPPEDTTPFWSPDSPIHLLPGGSFRWMTLWTPDTRTFPMQLDLYAELQAWLFRVGGSIGMTKLREGSSLGRAAQVTTGDTGLQMVAREYYIGGQLSPTWLIRAGRMNLPFGLPMPNHILWVRAATDTDRESDQQLGLQASYEGSWFRASLMGIAGNIQIHPSEFWKHGYSGYAEFLLADRVSLGASSLVTVADDDAQRPGSGHTVQQAHGLFSRLVPWTPLVFMVEADALLRTDGVVGVAALAEADYEPIQGLHFDATGELLKGTDEALDTRLGLWLSVNWFFLPHLNVRLDGRFRTDDSFTLMSQIHAYL